MIIGLLQHSESITVSTDLSIKPSKHLDFGSISLAARINLSEWSNNPNSRQYISFIKSKTGTKSSEYFRDFIRYKDYGLPTQLIYQLKRASA